MVIKSLPELSKGCDLFCKWRISVSTDKSKKKKKKLPGTKKILLVFMGPRGVHTVPS